MMSEKCFLTQSLKVKSLVLLDLGSDIECKKITHETSIVITSLIGVDNFSFNYIESSLFFKIGHQSIGVWLAQKMFKGATPCVYNCRPMRD